MQLNAMNVEARALPEEREADAQRQPRARWYSTWAPCGVGVAYAFVAPNVWLPVFRHFRVVVCVAVIIVYRVEELAIVAVESQLVPSPSRMNVPEACRTLVASLQVDQMKVLNRRRKIKRQRDGRRARRHSGRAAREETRGCTLGAHRMPVLVAWSPRASRGLSLSAVRTVWTEMRDAVC